MKSVGWEEGFYQRIQSGYKPTILFQFLFLLLFYSKSCPASNKKVSYCHWMELTTRAPCIYKADFIYQVLGAGILFYFRKHRVSCAHYSPFRTISTHVSKLTPYLTYKHCIFTFKCPKCRNQRWDSVSFLVTRANRQQHLGKRTPMSFHCC